MNSNSNYINLQREMEVHSVQSFSDFGKSISTNTTITEQPIQEDVWDEAITKSGFMSEYVDRLHLLNWLKEHYTLIKK